MSGREGRVATPARGPSGLERLHPAAGAAVMATGIVAVGLRTTGHRTPSIVLVLVGALTGVVLAGVVVVRLVRGPGSVLRGAAHPEALTAVAALCVIGSWCVADGRQVLASVLLAVGAALWLLLIGPALRHLPRRAHGSAFLVSVATEAVAVTAAGLAAPTGATWLLVVAAAFAVLGLVLYVVVLRRFGPGELLRGRGDHWVAGGALAIATLAVAKLVTGAAALRVVPDALPAARVAVGMLALVALAWLVALVAAELLRPRLGYDARRWATVFPVGMYAAAAVAAGRATRLDAPVRFASVWVWAGLAAWVVVASGLVRVLVRRGARPAGGRSAAER